MLEGVLIPFVLIFAVLLLAFHLAWKLLPGCVKQRLLNPLFDHLWRRPLRTRGVLFAGWWLYTLLVIAVAICLFSSGPITGRALVVLVLLSVPIFVVKALLNYRLRRR